MGWEQYVGPFGGIHAIRNRFGASAPYKVLAEHYGFTTEAVVSHAEELLEGFRNKAQWMQNLLACSER